MAKKKSGNKIWVAGAVLGAVAGAAFALWKTPMSGHELRGKLSTGPVAENSDVQTMPRHTPSMGDRILSKVEQTLAPIVGVELGKTASETTVTTGATTRTIVPPKPAPEPVEPKPDPEPAAPKRAEGPAPKPEPDVSTRAVERTPPNEAGTAASAEYNANSIRARRFAWGDPTPEAGVHPIPANTANEQIAAAADPKPVPEPVEVATQETEIADYAADSNRGERFAWGDPAPDAPGDAASTAGSQTAAVEPVPATSPLEPSTSAGSAPGTKMRKFPKLGGLED